MFLKFHNVELITRNNNKDKEKAKHFLFYVIIPEYIVINPEVVWK